MKTTIKVLLTAVVLNSLSLQVIAETSPDIAVRKQQTVRELVAVLERQYQPLTDSMGSRLIDDYTAALDPQRRFLLQSDIAEFEKYRAMVVDELHRGGIAIGSAIFDKYRQRAIERHQRTIETLSASVAQMKFDGDDYFEPEPATGSSWPQDMAASDAGWALRLKGEVLEQRLNGKSNPEIVELLTRRYRFNLRRLEKLADDNMLSTYLNAVAGMYQGGDRDYMAPPPARMRADLDMSLQLVGIGLVLKSNDGYVEVSRAVPGGPAYKQGTLKQGDRIVAIGQGAAGEMRDVVGWPLDEAVELVRGESGSVVRLDVIPIEARASGQHRILEITRARVALTEQGVTNRVIELQHNGKAHRVGVVVVPMLYRDFDAVSRGDQNYRSATRDVQASLATLTSANVEGIILDLRHNGGGALDEMDSLAQLFIESGPTVQLRSGSGKVQKPGKRKSGPYYEGPLLVLIDRLTASGAEAVAGTLQDYQRALLAGSRSFGAGTTQQLKALPYGAIELNEGAMYRISGESIEDRGVTPDIVFPSLYDAAQVGRTSKAGLPATGRIAPVQHTQYFDIAGALPSLRAAHGQRVEGNTIFRKITEVGQQSTASAGRISLNESVRKKQQSNAVQPLVEAEVEDALLQEAARILIDGIPVFSASVAK